MVARSTWDGAMTVYRFGCPSWARLDDVGMEQLRLAHELRNELVAIEHRRQLLYHQARGRLLELRRARDAVPSPCTRSSASVVACTGRPTTT